MNALVGDLINLGLSELEARVYLNLLKKKYFTATELAKASRIHRTQIYDILSNLVQKGMCVEILGSIKKYEAVDPKRVMNNFAANLDVKKQTARQLSESLSQVFSNNINNLDPLDFIKVLRTPTSIREHVFALIQQAESMVRVFNKPPYAMNPARNEPETRSLTKGIRHCCIYEVEEETAAFIERIEYFRDQGEEVRLARKLPLKLVIFDSRCVVMTLYHAGEPGSQFTAMSVEHADFALAMADIFDLYWNNSMTLEEYKDKQRKN
ncbi:MAG: hypothetical protein JXB60_02025 [Candidatus Cloacimonetes bacterium]|nr:hypothetical protein [Candidatus Cloacimonadota bacterium]